MTRSPVQLRWTILAMLVAFIAGMHLGGYCERTRRCGEDLPRASGAKIVRLRSPRLPVIVERTAYSLTVDQTDADPGMAACGPIAPPGVEVAPGRFAPAVAVSRDLMAAGLRCGDRVHVDGRPYVVWDTMHPRWCRRVDVLTTSREEALRLGIRPATLERSR